MGWVSGVSRRGEGYVSISYFHRKMVLIIESCKCAGVMTEANFQGSGAIILTSLFE